MGPAGSDASIVRRTQAGLAACGEPSVHFAAYFTIATAYWLEVISFFGTIMQILSQSYFGRALLLTFPAVFLGGVFRKGGPSQAQLDGASFSMTFVGKGYSKGAPRLRPFCFCAAWCCCSSTLHSFLLEF
jgi:hypothetical protein